MARDLQLGIPCIGRLFKKSLCHAFKTDAVKLVFGTSRAKNKATMLSVMYPLLEARLFLGSNYVGP